MFIYNRLTEIVITQFLIIAIFEIAVLGVGIMLFKIKLPHRAILSTLGIALMLSIFSAFAARGHYGGTLFHEHFGWPVQFNTISRHVHTGDSPLPYDYSFQPLRFLANTFFWIFLPVMLYLGFSGSRKDRKRILFAVISLLFFIVLTACFSYQNSRREFELRRPHAGTILLLPTPSEALTIGKKRNVLEAIYPELKDWEKQKSFAGQTIKVEQDGDDHYFAYIVNGSGVFIIQATCFKVDKDFKVTKIGTFPKSGESLAGYNDIDPKTGKGIK